ncbi:helix-turn-helix domain-containing protein [Phenylobacterium sp. LjRoot219]|uniref:helix-turn-helix domain-containing protein n=1 Tax=Phenylobacterium sp. LjRoot219 TaxID=3342283 RepID=UPI003ECDF03E
MSKDGVFIVDTPERMKALADPLRQRLLAAFAQQPGTVKQVSTRLGEPITKLYRHVDQLVAAGFLRVTGEQRRRGAVERSFEAVGSRYVVAPAAEEDRVLKGDTMVRGALEQVLASARKAEDPDGRLHLMRARVRLTSKALRHLEDRLRELLVENVSDDGDETEVLLLFARTEPDD